MQRVVPVSAPLAPGLRLAILEGCVAMVPQTFTTGVFITGFVLMLGADPWALGLLAAILALGQSAQLFTPLLLARGVERKALTVWGAAASRWLWAPMAAVPFLPLPAPVQLGIFFVLLGLSTMLAQMGGVAWADWMADLVPDHQRGWYFGLRSALCALVGMGLVWGGSRFLETLSLTDRRWGFAVLVGVGLLGAVASQIALSRQPEVARARPVSRRSPFRAPLANKPFLRMTAMLFAWTMVVGMTGPFCYAYALKDMQLGYGVVGTHALVVAGLSIVSQPWWGRLIDRIGAQKALVIAMAPICLHPLYWATLRPDFTAPFWLDALSSGLVWPGVTLATSALLMEAAPSGQRAGYMGLFNACMGVAACLAAVAGGALLTHFGHAGFAVGAWTLTGWQLLMTGGLIARLACMGAMTRLPAIKAPTLYIETWPGGLSEPVAPARVIEERARPASGV